MRFTFTSQVWRLACLRLQLPRVSQLRSANEAAHVLGLATSKSIESGVHSAVYFACPYAGCRVPFGRATLRGSEK